MSNIETDNRLHELELAMRSAQVDISNLAKMLEMNRQALTKLENEIEQRFEAIGEWSSGVDEMLNELNHALPDPEYDAKCEAAFAGREASLDRHRERLGLNKSELTGSDLCRKMLERGDKYVMCKCWCDSYADIEHVIDVVSGFAFEVGKKAFAGVRHNWDYAIPINNQGEPLTAAEAGL